MDSYDEKALGRLRRMTEQTDGCWLWTGAKSVNGYGKLYYRGRLCEAHRVAWLLANGPISPGLVVAHRCDIRNCVRPDHLFLATQAENLADMRAKRRHASGPALSAAIKAGWTPEKRAKKAEQMRHRRAANHTEAAQAAGVPSDWKRCPECRTWKPRTDYQRNAARSDGIKPICRPCASAQAQRLRIRRKLG